MPKRKNPLTPKEQRKRFEDEVQRRIAAGELSPTETDERLDAMIRQSIKLHGA